MNHTELVERLKQARRHVVEGQICLARQREIIARLGRDGHPTGRALRLLREMERAQSMRMSSAELHYSELEYREQLAAARMMLKSWSVQ